MGAIPRIRTQKARPSAAAIRCLPVPAQTGAGRDSHLPARHSSAESQRPFDRRHRTRGTRRVPHADNGLAAVIRLYLQHAGESPPPDHACARLPRLAGLDILR